MTESEERKPGRDQQAEEDHADHDKSVALAKRTGLSYCHVTDRYVCNWMAYPYVPVSNIVKRRCRMPTTIKLNQSIKEPHASVLPRAAEKILGVARDLFYGKASGDRRRRDRHAQAGVTKPSLYRSFRVQG